MDKAVKNTIYGDVLKHYKTLAEGEQAIAYCHSIDASKHTAEIFNDAGYKATHIDAKTPKDERADIIEAFRNHEIKILCRTLVRHWVRIYNYHGWEGLVGGGKSYTTKFKLDVIEYMETNGLSIQETAKKFNIGSNRTLSKWIEQYEEGGASSLESQKRGRKISMNSKLNIPKKLKDESLEEEVIRLRAENAYLKKLETLIQEQDLSKKKSRLNEF
ncbi:hypothetical protein EfmAA242_20340 [Enterococcus faecium]|nr:hypothetical protein EfmAA242_20340 [Enterococcus faecium]